MNELGELLGGFDVQDIKKRAMTGEQVDQMKELAGSYEALFSKRSRSYQSRGLASATLTEEDMKNLIVEDYTFLKRPVFIVEDQIFVGNAAKTIEELRSYL
ncbi:MAG: arsenate reductase [Cyclobacteriaceae bacterium]|jgi:arsenate reductase